MCISNIFYYSTPIVSFLKVFSDYREITGKIREIQLLKDSGMLDPSHLNSLGKEAVKKMDNLVFSLPIGVLAQMGLSTLFAGSEKKDENSKDRKITFMGKVGCLVFTSGFITLLFGITIYFASSEKLWEAAGIDYIRE
ncbi:MAG: hypothetical protein L0207_07055 [Chlamydiae bacterium]|nr:hypothetical protein [Chlamydiota bacterium]